MCVGCFDFCWGVCVVVMIGYCYVLVVWIVID